MHNQVPWCFWIVVILGAWWWMDLYHWGRLACAGPYDVGQIVDWLRLLQVAVTTQELPLYMAQHMNRYWTRYQDNRVGELLYWAHPMTPLLPQALLLTVLPLGQTIAATVLWFYLLGAAGVAAIVRRYRLGPIPAVLLLVLLLGNGFLVSKLTVWWSWESMFLLPWVIFFTFRAVEGERSAQSALGLGLVFAAIVYQGYLHTLAMFVLFLGLLAICVPWCAWWVGQVYAWTGVLGAAKILPILWMYPPEPRNTMPGFFSVAELWGALTGFGVQPAWTYWWESDGCVGVAATLFVLAYGIVTPGNSRHWWRHLVLALPIGVMILWACDPSLTPLIQGPLNWGWWRATEFSLFVMERAPRRFLVIPFSILATSACIALQRKIDHRVRWSLMGLLVLGWTCWALQTHAVPLRSGIVAGDLQPPTTGAFLLSNPPDQQTYQTGQGAFALPLAQPPRVITYDTVRYRQVILMGLVITALGLGCAFLLFALADLPDAPKERP